VHEVRGRPGHRSRGPRRAALFALSIAGAALAFGAYASAGTIPSVRAVTEVTAQSPVDPGPQVTAPPVAAGGQQGAQQPVAAAPGARDLGTIALMTLAFVAVGMGAVVLDRRRRFRSSSSA